MKVIHKRFYFLFFFTSIIISTSFAVDISLGSSLNTGGKGQNPVWLNLEGGAAYKSKGFTFDMLLKADTSGLYTQPFHGNFFGNFDVQIAHGFILEGYNKSSVPKHPKINITRYQDEKVRQRI